MKTMPFAGLAVLAALTIAGCASSPVGPQLEMIGGGRPGAQPPKPYASAAEVPRNLKTFGYSVQIYPGLDENFDPNPTLTYREVNQLTQLDWTCTRIALGYEGYFREMLKQGITIGTFSAVFTGLAAKYAFPHASFNDYMKYGGIAGFGSGMASGKITVDAALAIVHSYCMTGMVYKADQLEGKLSRIIVTPSYTGSGALPQVSDKPAPVFQRQRHSVQPALPIR